MGVGDVTTTDIDADVAVASPAPVTYGAAASAASVAVRSELFAKPLSDDNVLGQFGNYLCKVGQHICLDAGDARDWIAEKVRGEGFDGEDVLETGNEGSVAEPRKKKILILMSDTGAGAKSPACGASRTARCGFCCERCLPGPLLRASRPLPLAPARLQLRTARSWCALFAPRLSGL